ncbi:MAG: S8 family serine peptidase [Acidobacteriota bacterium]
MFSRAKWQLLMVLALCQPALSLASQAPAFIDPWVVERTHGGGEAEFLIVLHAQADTAPARQLQSKEARGAWVMSTLKAVAEATQGPVLKLLQELGIPHRSYWIVNMIWARGNDEAVRRIAELPEVAKILPNPSVPLQRPMIEETTSAPDAVEWGITKTGAPSVWSMGYRGQNVVIAGQDTGYQWDHPALKSKYRGWNGTTADHNYNWHDAIHSGGGVCGPNSQVPCDDDTHGTHTMGTMVGDDGGSNQIGMAPQAKWIGCRNMNQGNGTPATYSECFQWFIAPTNLAGGNPDPAKAPHVINNSWGCPPSEGCTDPQVLRTVVENTRNAGIVVVVSAGNSGSSCGSVVDPPAIYDASYSVGATNSSDTIASFSSRGPVTVDGSNRLKPDISAPGVSVRSSVPGNSYSSMSGTSMAGPHVAGAVALLLSAVPGWIGQVDQVEERLNLTANRNTTPTGQVCGGIPDNQFPNNTYGYGRVDIYKAINEANLGLSLTDAPDPVGVGQNLVYTATVHNGGPRPATAVTLTVTLPASVTYVSATGWCSLTGVTLTCTLGSLPNGASTSVQITVVPNASGSITATSNVTSSMPDYTPANNSAQATTQVVAGAPDLAAGLAAAPDPALVGRQLVYTLSASNVGSGTAVGASATLTLPGAVNFSSASGGCAHNTGIVTCALGDVAPAGSAQRTVTVIPTAVGTLSATLTVTASGDANPANNSAQSTVEAVEMQAIALALDEAPLGNGNGVLEPGETVLVRPTWRNPSGGGVTQSGTAVSFFGPPGGTYLLDDASASYGTIAPGGEASCTDCYQITVPVPASRPTLHWDATLSELLTTGASKAWTIHIGGSFGDVPPERWGYRFIETILHHRVTSGCGGGNFCPASTVSRWQMAVFLARLLHPGPLPPSGTVPGLGPYNCVEGGTSVFTDVPPTDPGCRAVHYTAAQGVTDTCGANVFCPETLVSRRKMAEFLARALVGEPVPPTGTVPGMGPYQCGAGGFSVFGDVPPTDGACPHIHYIAAQRITSGCGGGNYCPDLSIPRDQMSIFLTRAFGLKLYGP